MVATTTRPRSAERNQFLADVLVTAIEAGSYGTGSWAVVQSWGRINWDHPLDARERTHATIVEFAGEDPGVKVDLPVLVTVDTIASGINRFDVTPDEHELCAGIHRSYAKEILAASRHNDAGDIDGPMADMIVQAGVLGKVVFG